MVQRADNIARSFAYRQNAFADLGDQSEKIKICQSTLERDSGEPSHGLGLVFPILRTLKIRSGQRPEE
jgi:hypothetical protein